jgi:3-oxoacyl-[acyl-carrier-protein] synthase II
VISDTSQVVVTGMGAITPLGDDVTSTWSAMIAGKSGIRRLDEDWAQSLPVRIAAPAPVDLLAVTSASERRRTDRSVQLALATARQAWQHAGEPSVKPERLAISIGVGLGSIGSIIDAQQKIRDKSWRRLSPFTVPMFMHNDAAATLGIELDAQAGSHAFCGGCAGAEGIGFGIGLIRAGRADVVVAGGTDAAILPLCLAAFARMRVLSLHNDEPERACRPFDKSGDGFVIGEGAGVVVLESAGHAARRGAMVHAVAAGAGYASDPDGLMRVDPDALTLGAAMRAALADAKMTAERVVHINAHASANPDGDGAEITAIEATLGSAARGVCVSATKAMTGHLLGGAGAVEAIASICALRASAAPPTLNLEVPRDEVRVAGIRVAAEPCELVRKTGPRVALSNSGGFGGQCVTLAFETA